MTQAAFRAAVVDLLTDFASDESIGLQVYPGRPRSLNPPTAFIDTVNSRIEYSGPTQYQQTVSVDVILVHGTFDSKESTAQKDDFVDAFLAYVVPQYHEAGANTLVALTETEDLPVWVPDWLPPQEQRTYFATRIVLEGYAEDVAAP